MDLNEMKKMLYRENPYAYLYEVRKDGITYILDDEITRFFVPISEIGEVVWEKEMPAKLLIRYIINKEN